MKKIYILLFSLVLMSCSLSKDNPLDPDNSGIDAPSTVSNIIVQRPVSGYVPISWDEVNQASGYYIYRSQSYYGEYILHEEISNSGITQYNDNKNYISGTFYYYILSAYKLIDDNKLEGTRSGKVTWR